MKEQISNKQMGFEQYLQKWFLKENPQVLDDDINDRFDGWLENLDVGDVMWYAEGYAQEVREAEREKITEGVAHRISELVEDYESGQVSVEEMVATLKVSSAHHQIPPIEGEEKQKV